MSNLISKVRGSSSSVVWCENADCFVSVDTTGVSVSQSQTSQQWILLLAIDVWNMTCE